MSSNFKQRFFKLEKEAQWHWSVGLFLVFAWGLFLFQPQDSVLYLLVAKCLLGWASPKNVQLGHALCIPSSSAMILLWGRLQGLVNSATQDIFQGEMSLSIYTGPWDKNPVLWGSPHWNPKARFSSQCCYVQPPTGKWWKRQQHQQMDHGMRPKKILSHQRL